LISSEPRIVMLGIALACAVELRSRQVTCAGEHSLDVGVSVARLEPGESGSAVGLSAEGGNVKVSLGKTVRCFSVDADIDAAAGEEGAASAIDPNGEEGDRRRDGGV
jgi:hypothetical protein